ncbi:hypothetical protein HFN20_02130 [Paenibacillus dendritiformis]|uniref:hypothetical protein n=1 Tax=Paenibacillus dendritiformis TaxID=130049 RepID=UPI00143D7166|nr:hypothetical protein [Paenibacillus dendritiformis]NKI20041.1 hypothetical protein [Paenibacillus dendritiformis]NRF98280.1 hypothetical protein [Paenibacillus dendritiformis]
MAAAWIAVVVVRMMRLAFLALALVVMMPLWFAFLAFAVVMMMPLALMAVRLAAASRHIHRSLFAAARFPFYFHDPAPFDIAQPLHEHILTNDVILFGQIEFQLLSTGIFNLKFG